MNPNKEYQLLNSITIYSNNNFTYTLTNLIFSFKDIFTNIRKIVNIPKAYQIPIKFKIKV